MVFPPVSLSLFTRPLPRVPKKHYLSFGTITPYKKIDLLMDTFNQNGKALIIIGDGSEKGKLQQIASHNIRFSGTLSWVEVQQYIDHSRALLFPGEEDFGIVPLEVMAAGFPVIAYQKEALLKLLRQKREPGTILRNLFWRTNAGVSCTSDHRV